MPGSRINTSSLFKNLDWFTIILYVIMVLAGVVSIFAASYDFDQASIFSFDEFSGKQIRWILMAFFIGFVLLLFDTRMYETYAFPIYVLVTVILLITPFIAPDIKGSRSWLVFGPMSLQPAEFAKFATALALAKLFSQYGFSLNAKFSNYIRACVIILLPVCLILLQQETGSALTFLALFFVLYREGMSGLILFSVLFGVVVFVLGLKYSDTEIIGISEGKFWVFVLIMAVMSVMVIIKGNTPKRVRIAGNVIGFFAFGGAVLWILATLFSVEIPGLPIMLGMIGLATAYLLIEAIKERNYSLCIPAATALLSIVFLFSVNFAFEQLQPHQQLRIKVALGMEQDLRGAGYNVNQSKIAIGSGGLTGKGFLNGTQTKLKYVPEQHTDFIFCTIGEEEGFIGTMSVMALFLLLILRVINIAERQPTTFGRVYAYCVAAFFIFHFCINIGMVIGLCPVIGIPLPFFSYGGSSLWAFTILLFILLRIDAGRKNVLTY
ncbi:MAG: rod shape-determining protein RodA [Muribaculaceae bacterium]|nr:rod shape-determining protein RodA [Muribaculaceae bacterium]